MATVASLGVAISVDSVLVAQSKAASTSRAVAIDAGAGGDMVTNTGALVANSVAVGSDLNVSVSKSFSLAGNGIFDGGTTATSEAIGISGDGLGREPRGGNRRRRR